MHFSPGLEAGVQVMVYQPYTCIWVLVIKMGLGFPKTHENSHS